MGFWPIRAKSARKIVVFIADTHGGHRLGLMAPNVVLQDEDELGNLIPYTPRPTATQEYLWRCYEEDLDKVERLADGSPIVIVDAGDLTHGVKYPEQLVSSRPSDQIAIAVANLRRAMELSNVQAVRLVQGTGAHSFGEGSAGVLVAQQLQAKHPDASVSCLFHGLFDADDIKIDCAHHGPSPGIRNWTAGNQLRYYARSVVMDALADGERPPDVLVRAHYHTKRHETVRVETKRGVIKIEAVILPSYCGLSGHGRQATRSAYRVTNGLMALEIEGGKLAGVHHFGRMVDLRTRDNL